VNNGLRAIGVTYGYGSAEELRNAGAESLATSPRDLPGLI
jgi:phosphoglycolate phosphatase